MGSLHGHHPRARHPSPMDFLYHPTHLCRESLARRPETVSWDLISYQKLISYSFRSWTFPPVLLVFVSLWFEELDGSPWCVNNVHRINRKKLDIEVFEIWNCNNF